MRTLVKKEEVHEKLAYLILQKVSTSAIQRPYTVWLTDCMLAIQVSRAAFGLFWYFFWAPFSPKVFQNHKYRITGWKLVYLSKRKFQPWNQFTWFWLLPLSWILLRPFPATQTFLMTAAKVQPLISGAACEEQGDPWPVFKYNFL